MYHTWLISTQDRERSLATHVSYYADIISSLCMILSEVKSLDNIVGLPLLVNYNVIEAQLLISVHRFRITKRL